MDVCVCVVVLMYECGCVWGRVRPCCVVGVWWCVVCCWLRIVVCVLVGLMCCGRAMRLLCGLDCLSELVYECVAGCGCGVLHVCGCACGCVWRV